MSTTAPTTSHWGAFRVRRTERGGIDVLPHPDDPAPSPLQGGVAGALDHPRVRRPAVRRGRLDNGRGPTTARGTEPFVEVEWDHTLDLAAAELARLRREHGNQAPFGGSSGSPTGPEAIASTTTRTSEGCAGRSAARTP
ncbi:molybdopterin-dependent oxidoreductase [Yinghuangia sp. ASG 101]|uniref:molybdopterin-dependent oxidoreductase n=1 Tax=Yinghuangia sp. ASG 101 TaxID=2896848 RepID=UPI001E4E84BC|nr:molybdopterin-dependent oxidoreductase [Yinghuangia sp. ASG 101]UGQ12129.1 molybdopterin-dependent oxidoreductase [Yinghuangia sp. ASG 101]